MTIMTITETFVFMTGWTSSGSKQIHLLFLRLWLASIVKFSHPKKKHT
uniref:Uncharacterized protein n=1 Tax=Lepeophtheirus salmonis TaxID=72036 RepID=A0A0K2TEY0_LEPSM